MPVCIKSQLCPHFDPSALEIESSNYFFLGTGVAFLAASLSAASLSAATSSALFLVQKAQEHEWRMFNCFRIMWLNSPKSAEHIEIRAFFRENKLFSSHVVMFRGIQSSYNKLCGWPQSFPWRLGLILRIVWLYACNIIFWALYMEYMAWVVRLQPWCVIYVCIYVYV